MIETPIYRGIEIDEDVQIRIRTVVRDFIDELYQDELESCTEYWRNEKGVPSVYDKSLLIECRNALDRNLSDVERQEMRSCFRDMVLSTNEALVRPHPQKIDNLISEDINDKNAGGENSSS